MVNLSGMQGEARRLRQKQVRSPIEFKDATPARQFEPLRHLLRLTRDARILRRYDLPFPGAFEPRVGPDQTTLCRLTIFGLGDRAFRSIRYGDGVAEKSHLYLAQLAVARERLGICGDRFVLVVTPSAWRCPLEVVRNHVLKIRLRATGRVGPLRLGRNDELHRLFPRRSPSRFLPNAG